MNWIFEWTDIYEPVQGETVAEFIESQFPDVGDYKVQDEYKDGSVEYAMWMEFEADDIEQAKALVRTFYDRRYASEVFRCHTEDEKIEFSEEAL